MEILLTPLAMSDGAKFGIAAGVIVFILLFIKLIIGFIKFCFRHPILFVLLLIFGGLGIAFNVLLAGILIVAVIAGFGVLSLFNVFDL
ncbi:hypothetical protein [Paucilactobacillus nenjiangensis]|jgi:hypothetical protein|uniref:Uncharacterized protein n=1 Tax=Paucilactobacillus nenjiangensis TaxID=1296540 RepID=A0A5P1X024_9LACO|nr:hypothetical protein [Paucilactobacillus nenjiangensis]QER66853.1 hypothetical protein F0161_02495 [Paucilactobacillus nenjiangensis]